MSCWRLACSNKMAGFSFSAGNGFFLELKGLAGIYVFLIFNIYRTRITFGSERCYQKDEEI